MRRFASAAAVAIALGGAAATAGVHATPAPPRGAAVRGLAEPPAKPAIASQRIYFVMPDRYANGDTSNDTGGRVGPRSVTGFDPSDTGFYHGGDFAGLTGDCTGPRGLARIRDLGFNSIWVTPPYWQKYVQGDSAAYHGYWAIKFSSVDPHLGPETEFAEFVDCAHRLGMKVILDVVVNHTADVIQLPSYEYGAPKTPIVPPAEADVKDPSWLNDPSNYHNRGNIDFNSCPPECLVLGDFFGLDDLATEQADVREGLANVFAGWIERYKIDGFRIDTARHVEPAFFHAWVPRMFAAAQRAGVRDFQLFGEAFIGNAVELSSYVRDRGLPNVLDFPMQDALARFAGGSAGANGIATRLADDDYFDAPGNVAHVPPTFLGNHDIGRAALQVRDKGSGGGAQLLERTLLAHDLLYLLRGAPVEYYGDEFGIVGRGGDKEARHDLFPTQIAEWQTQERVGAAPIGTRSYFDEPEHPVARRLRSLGALRAAHPVLSTGATIVRRADRNVLAVSRIDAADPREYLALFNAGTSTARFTIQTSTPGAEWLRLLGAPPAFSTSASGRATISLPPLSSAFLQASRPIPNVRAYRPVLSVGRDSLSDLTRLRATVRGTPAAVSFAIRRTGRPWTLVAADDSPPYRAFLDPADFRRRERVYVVALTRGLNGSTSVSRVRSTVPRR